MVNNQKVRRPKSSWISRMVENRKDDLDRGLLTAAEVSRNADRIIDDIINKRILEDYNQYMMMPVILNTLTSYCSNKVAVLTATNYALSYTIADKDHGYIIPNSISQIQVFGNNNERQPAFIDHVMASNLNQALSINNEELAKYTKAYFMLKSLAETGQTTPYAYDKMVDAMSAYAPNKLNQKY